MVHYNDFKPEQIIAFWKHMIMRHRQEMEWGAANHDGMRWHELDAVGFAISLTVGIDFVRVFIRGLENAKAGEIKKRLEPWADKFELELGAPLKSGESNKFFSSRLDLDMTDTANWDEAADFLAAKAPLYEATLFKAFERKR